jgi:hypothetical protein
MEGVYDEKIMQSGFGNLLPINLTLELIPEGLHISNLLIKQVDK